MSAGSSLLFPALMTATPNPLSFRYGTRSSPQHSGRVARDDGERWHVLRHDAPGPHQRALPDRQAAEDHGAAADGSAALDPRRDHGPVRVGLERPIRVRRLGIGVVDEDHVVADEALVVDDHALADERVGRDLAVLADLRVLLDLDEGPDLARVTDLAAVEVHEPVDLHALPELDVGSVARELGRGTARFPAHAHTATFAAPLAIDVWAASSIRTTFKPAVALDHGILLKRTHSRKCSHSIASA